ncbi:MAG: lysylphosphatidylglycerol synthase transmembrane domain-containing protein, partial [Anaerolineales bacterium]
IDVIIYLFITARWWLIVQAENKNISYLPMIGVRVAVFGISYFTIGPQVGGEPLQVIYLQRKYGLTYTRAASTVVMDKLLELLANFILLVFGLTGIVQAGILSKNGSPPLVSLIVLSALVAWPLIHIILLYKQIYPLSRLLQMLSFIQNTKAVRFLRASEHLAGRFCQRQTRALLAAIFVSILAAMGMVSEYFLMTSFLQIHLSFWQTVAAWTAGWLSFLVPLPGGLGALEASQVFALGFFGISAASAISVTLAMRARDLLIGGLGLLLAGRMIAK